MKRLSFVFLICFLSSSPALADIFLAPLPVKKSRDDLTAGLLAELSKKIQRKEKIISYEPPGPAAERGGKGLSAALERARDEQFNFQDRKAIETLKKALAIFEENPADLVNIAKLADAHLFIAFCHRNLGETEAMNRALDEAARLNPSLKPSELDFPPSLIAVFEQAKDRIWRQGRFGQLMIESDPPGAQIYINGGYKGKTPLRLDRYPVGEHHFLAISDAGQAYKKVALKEGSNPAVKMRPAKHSPSPSSPRKKTEKTYSSSDFKGQARWLAAKNESHHTTKGLGVAVLEKGNKAAVVVTPVGFAGPPQILFMPLPFNPQAMAEKIAQILSL